MKLEEMSGRKIKWVFFPNDEFVQAKDGKTITCRNEFYGDHEVDWAIVADVHGNEIARHNLHHAVSIVWEAPDA